MFCIDGPGLSTIEAFCGRASLVHQDAGLHTPVVVDVVGHLKRLDVPGISEIKKIALVPYVLETNLVDVSDLSTRQQLEPRDEGRVGGESRADHQGERHDFVPSAVSIHCGNKHSAAFQVI